MHHKDLKSFTEHLFSLSPLMGLGFPPHAAKEII